MAPSLVRASELGTFAFCQRAWHYARSGVPLEHLDRTQRGIDWHNHVEKRTRSATFLIQAGALLLLCGTLILFIAPSFS